MNEIIQIPKGWKIFKIKEICKLINGRIFKPTDWTSQGLPIIRIQNLNNPDKSFNHYDSKVDKKFVVNNGELLFAWSGTPGTSFGAHIWDGEQAILNQHIFRVIPDIKIIEKIFLKYLLNKNLDNFIGQAHGGVGLRHITKPKFEETQVFIPPKEIQKQIVTKLDHILGELEVKKKEILSLIEQNKQRINFFENSWMYYIIDREIEKHSQRGEWELKKLSEVCQNISSGGTPSRNNSEYYGGNILWLKIGDLNNGIITNSNEKITQEGLENSSAKLFPINTVLFAMYGATIGKTGILETQCATNQAICGMVSGDKLNPNFLLYFLQSKYHKIRKMAEGGAQPNINQNKLKNFKIPLPDLFTQKEIIQNIKNAEEKFKKQKIQFENIKQNYDSKIKYINHIQPAILDSAFSGKLVN